MRKGQTLITLLIFVGVILTIFTPAIMINIINIMGSSKVQRGSYAYLIAESGAEEALLRLLRDPNYQGGTLQIGNGTAEIVVASNSGMIITSVGEIGSHEKRVRVELNVEDDLIINTWKEVQ